MTIAIHRGEILHFLDDPAEHTAEHWKDAWQYFADGALVIEQGHIIACGDASEVIPQFAGGEVISHPNCLIIPGLIDTHLHYPQCEIIAAYGTQLLDWLQQHTFPAEARFAERAHADKIAAVFVDELLRNGTTTALVFGTVHPQSVDAFFAQVEARNLRMICGKVMMDRNAPAELCDTPRFAPTSSPQQLQLAGKLFSDNPSVHLHTHLAENVRECEWVAELFPLSCDYLDVYDRHGLLGRRSVFAHSIHLNEREWARLSASDSNLAFCPASNLFIGSGLFPLHKAADMSYWILD